MMKVFANAAKRCIGAASALAAAGVLLASCGSSNVKGKPAGAVYAAERPVLIDYKGQALGREIPAWVEAVADGDKAATKKELKLDKDMMVFIITKDGENLDFLKTWADQIDARSEVASSLETTIAQTVQTELTAAQTDKETVERKAEMYSAQATNITLNGLQKINDYWTKTRTLKTGVKKAQSDDDYNYKTTYYVVFGMDSEVYKQQLTKALDDVEDNDEATAFLRDLLTQKCTEALLPATLPTFEE